MPTSVMAAVPLALTRSSAVCTCVWVPITAVTRPSRYCDMAIFSLVASAWRSTTMVSASVWASSTRASTMRNGEMPVPMKTWPMRLMTATSTPPAAARTVRPRPGLDGGKLAGRTMRALESRNG